MNVLLMRHLATNSLLIVEAPPIVLKPAGCPRYFVLIQASAALV